MTIHPIAVVEQVLDEYKSYLLTEFRARDEALRKALTEAIERPFFLAQEPFFQAYRAFREGSRWDELALDPRLAKVMKERSHSATAFLHQRDAITHLLGTDATPLAVTTGTGSGKTECFLLPVIQNAIEDAATFKQPGLTSILIYPMNALANDQHDRIGEYLELSGHTYVRVARYDRSTSAAERAELRAKPPHILLTNYVMLEYLLVRPADREALFRDHRCRFVVLDEVHTYRGSLGANIALLYRRLLAHLRHATHDLLPDARDDRRRFPKLVPVATSATIKSVDESGRSKEEVTQLRREAVQEFLHALLGVERNSIQVLGEERAHVETPAHARWTPTPAAVSPPPLGDAKALAHAVARLAGLPEGTPIEQAAPRARILWTLGELLAHRPRSTSQIVHAVLEQVPERRGATADAVHAEVATALWCAAAIGAVPGALRLRVHRFIRGGWRFHRCVDPACGKLFPMGEESCSCGKPTAPLLLCRSCGADALHFSAEGDSDPISLIPRAPRGEDEQEWVLYDARRHEIESEDEDEADEDISASTRARRGKAAAQKLKGKHVLEGSFDPATCRFDSDTRVLPVHVVLAPARNRCLVCGSSAGARSILTSVALGTSAALRVLAEGVVEDLALQHKAAGVHESKERLLIFADSRQDAAHQARFISYAGRFDRMRRRFVRALGKAGRPLTIGEVLRDLLAAAFELRDNPQLMSARARDLSVVPRSAQDRALAWEEAPLLDDLAVTAGYRGTVFNLGLVGVRYGRLAEYIERFGNDVATSLGLTKPQLLYLAHCLLDEMRTHGALSRPMLIYHPANPNCPEEYRVHAEWERRLKKPQGYPSSVDGVPLGNLDASEVPEGISLTNAWRRSTRGRPPRLQRVFEHLVGRMASGRAVDESDLLRLLNFLRDGEVTRATKLFGFQKTRELIQVNAEAIELELVAARDRLRCSICNVRMAWVEPGSPCRACHGKMEAWPEEDVQANRYAQRILSASLLPLQAGEHTAQVTGEERIELEERFKSEKDPLNVLACSPTLEMGIDVGGLDAVLMRNVPPRPDNYAQRGGRAGRRSRVGVVVAYARSTPHDQYFYDKPVEMIAGEVAAPAIGLGNRDVVLRHLNAIALGSAEPGLAGRMGEYITLKGELVPDRIDELVRAFELRFDQAADLALEAWGSEILGPARLDTKPQLLALLREQPARIRDLFDRVRHQVIELQNRVKQWSELGVGKWNAMNAMDLSRNLLGLPSDDRKDRDADDRSSGHPMRRFAEFGILPGYEFPTEPATLRLLRDAHEEEPISVARRFGLAQYQPEAWAHARGHRWRVAGLDVTSPWNPRTEEPTWTYRVCGGCGLRFDAQAVSCKRCGSREAGAALPGYDFGGFLAVRDDAPVLEEEDRFSRAGLLKCYPQWDGDLIARYELPTCWPLHVYAEEQIRWVNEWRPPRSDAEKRLCLHSEARGFYLCPACGRILNAPAPDGGSEKKGRKAPRKSGDGDPFGHSSDCRLSGQPPRPLAITTHSKASTLRILLTLPASFEKADFDRWGLTLGYALRIGMRRLYMLDGSEIEFVLEGPWDMKREERRWRQASLTFIDPAVGGTGFLNRAAEELHLVAQRTIEHLDHPGCESACYRCLKSYENQRFHAQLSWPHALPDLEALGASPPLRRPRRQGDVFDPRPWIEAYDAQVGSPLELKFLRLLESKGIQVEKQVSIAVEEGKTFITVADFAIAAKRIAIYVDGAAFHQGENLRRDRYIRRRLRAATPPWRVFELTASDLASGLAPLRELFGEFPIVPEPAPPAREDEETDVDARPAPPPSVSSAPPPPLDDYEIVEDLGGGGMAECFKARERATGDIVFLKRVRDGSVDAAALERESYIYGRLQYLDCKHLLMVRDLRREGGFVALVTEFADGGDLKHFVEAKGRTRLPLREALGVALEIAKGLRELHDNSIVHRDLKPENVLRIGSAWKLADFGIAKSREHAAPGKTFQQAGTYGYAAPEQFEGVEAHPSADIYSFGKVMAFLLTGTTDPDKIRIEYDDWRKLAYRCAQYSPEARPSVGDVLAVLQRMAGELS